MNCLSECRQRYLITNCNCNPEWIFPVTPNIRGCRISDLKCFFDINSKKYEIFPNIILTFFYTHTDQMNYEKPPPGNRYFPDNEPGRVCYCLPDCKHVEYSYEITPAQVTRS